MKSVDVLPDESHPVIRSRRPLAGGVDCAGARQYDQATIFVLDLLDTTEPRDLLSKNGFDDPIRSLQDCNSFVSLADRPSLDCFSSGRRVFDR